MPPAARVTDMHTCPMIGPGAVPHVGGAVLPAGAPNVLIGFMPAAQVGDMLVCVGPPDFIVKGSPTVAHCLNRRRAFHYSARGGPFRTLGRSHGWQSVLHARTFFWRAVGVASSPLTRLAQ